MPFGEGPVDSTNPNQGYVVPQPPDDTVSSVRFSPTATPSPHLLASSWNGSVRLWSIDSPHGPASGVSETTLTKPVMDCVWSSRGDSAYIGCADRCVYRWDLASNNRVVVGAHDSAVRQCVDNEQLGVLATVSWDRTLRYWDTRTPASVASVDLGDRAYGVDSLGVAMVVILAERKIQVFDIRKPTQCFQQRYSKLRAQSRAVAVWPDAMGYVVAGVDGNVSVESIQQSNDHDSEDNHGVFSCHQDKNGPFVINAVRFNSHTGAFATAASDGHVFFWDKNRKSRAKAKKFSRMPAPVCDVDFYHDGSMYAYAVGYDWSKGSQGASQYPTHPNQPHNYIVLQYIEPGDISVGQNYSGGRGGYRGRGGRGGRRRGGHHHHRGGANG